MQSQCVHIHGATEAYEKAEAIPKSENVSTTNIEMLIKVSIYWD